MKQDKTKSAPSGIHAWLILWKTARAVEVYAHRSIQSLELGVSDFGILEALLHKGALPVNALGSKVLLTSSSMTSAVDRLEVQGLVERRDDPNDRRARLVALTEKGKSLITTAFKQHAKDMEKIMSPLNQSERDTLIMLLRKVGHNAAEIVGSKERI
jgi:MarR family 2-MHQ and catechol resistance regulon transcriptional repressor